ncbi:MAG: tRNA pseudouridine(55) synthase TruB [Arenimonas sp.]|nr:tRNA pseudouridine(55) synthase TruB [Arenimonas sp.]
MKKTQFIFPRRAVDGLILLDKPKGLTSNSALQKVRNLYKAEKAGHTGALDPLATGVLPICLGEATKVAGHLLGNDKAYAVTARLGQTTDTDDAEGQVLQTRPVGIYSQALVEQELRQFIGDIQQVPPIYSALKQGGEPMYVKARRGEVIDLPARTVSVHSIEIIKQSHDSIELSVVCGTGTYIRSLVRDLGERLGCGAHVTELRRTWVQPFKAEQVWQIEQLEALAEQGQDALDAALMPVEVALSAIPKLVVDEIQARKIGMGQKVQMPNVNTANELVQLCTPEGRCLGLASLDAHGFVKVQRLFCWASIS